MPWLPPELSAQSSAKAKEFKLRSPMTGKVLRVMVANGDEVKKGDELLVVEAMKMENRITAAVDGTIEGLTLTQGVNISSGQNLLKIVPAAATT
jgi:biotin carboxyl carrier protein